jgi:hypothetical protein
MLLRQAVRAGSVNRETGVNIRSPPFRSAGLAGHRPVRPRVPRDEKRRQQHFSKDQEGGQQAFSFLPGMGSAMEAAQDDRYIPRSRPPEHDLRFTDPGRGRAARSVPAMVRSRRPGRLRRRTRPPARTRPALPPPPAAGGRSYTARVVGYDRSQDIAVLQLQSASGLATVTLATPPPPLSATRSSPSATRAARAAPRRSPRARSPASVPRSPPRTHRPAPPSS